MGNAAIIAAVKNVRVNFGHILLVLGHARLLFFEVGHTHIEIGNSRRVIAQLHLGDGAQIMRARLRCLAQIDGLRKIGHGFFVTPHLQEALAAHLISGGGCFLHGGHITGVGFHRARVIARNREQFTEHRINFGLFWIRCQIFFRLLFGGLRISHGGVGLQFQQHSVRRAR